MTTITHDGLAAQVAAQYHFIGADACRALGMPDHPSLAKLTICILVTRNGFVVTGTSMPVDDGEFNAQQGVDVALADAHEKLLPMVAYAQQERAQFSSPIQTAIRLEQSGLPAGRFDVNPQQVPALAAEPLTFAQARSATIKVVDGLMDVEDFTAAFDEVRQQIAEADPPFPATLLGYTISAPSEPKDEAEVPVAVLTVYG